MRLFGARQRGLECNVRAFADAPSALAAVGGLEESVTEEMLRERFARLRGVQLRGVDCVPHQFVPGGAICGRDGPRGGCGGCAG